MSRFRLDLEAAEVGRASIAKVVTLLQGVLQRACEWERLSSNPVKAVRKPAPGRVRAVVPLAPETVESMRIWLLQRDLLRDATLVSVLAYAGLRPVEALALTWDHVRERTILVEATVSLGNVGETKTRRRRTVRLVAPLGEDLTVWQRRTRAPQGTALVFPGRDGEPWSEANYKNWRRRIYAPAAEAAGVEHARPYDLRHSFVSRLIADGRNVVEFARQAGHSPTMALDTYAHVVEEFDPAERIDAAERIRQACEQSRFASMQPRLFKLSEDDSQDG